MKLTPWNKSFWIMERMMVRVRVRASPSATMTHLELNLFRETTRMTTKRS